MEITGIEFGNYKAFEGANQIDIRPMTILIGKNSAGKSAIARLPLMIARSLSGDTDAPLELEFNGVDFGGSFLDLIHGKNPHGHIVIGASIRAEDGQEESFSAKIQHFDEYKLLHVQELSVGSERS